MTGFQAAGDALLVSGGKVHFAHPIAQVEDFGGVGVVRLEVRPGNHYNENVFGVSADRRILWQIERERHIYPDSPYTTLRKDGDLAVVGSWDGIVLWLDPPTGKVVKRFSGK